MITWLLLCTKEIRMKQPKKLKRNQKVILSKYKMDAKDYMVSKETADTFTVVHKKDLSKTVTFRNNGKRVEKVEDD